MKTGLVLQLGEGGELAEHLHDLLRLVIQDLSRIRQGNTRAVTLENPVAQLLLKTADDFRNIRLGRIQIF